MGVRPIAKKYAGRKFTFSCKTNLFLLFRSTEIAIIVSGTVKEKKALCQETETPLNDSEAAYSLIA